MPAPDLSTPVGPPVSIAGTNGERLLYNILRTPFEVLSYYEVVNAVGYGAYGFVVAAVDKRAGQGGRRVAIKKSARAFRDLLDCKRIVREVFVLHHLKGHENVLGIQDVYLSTPPLPSAGISGPTAASECNKASLSNQQPMRSADGVTESRDLYIVTDLMDTSLQHVIRSPGQPLDHTHFKFFAYQILRGLRFVHSAQVIHRDLKPANILVNVNCDLKICDFGLARQFSRDTIMTDYVVTRYYRPPEVLLMCSTYTCVVDTWSLGCIMAEMLLRKTMFKGRDYIQQLDLILNALRPTAADLTFLETPEAVEQITQRVEALERGWGPKAPLIPSHFGDPLLRDFIEKMLVFHPARRATAEELLRHPFVADLHDPTDEPVCATPFQWEFEGVDMSESLLRAEMNRAVQLFR